MDDLIKFVPDKEIFSNGLVPFTLIIFITIVIILVTIILVKKEIEGVKK